MVRYGRGVFPVEKGARRVACVGALSCALLGIAASEAAAGYSGTGIVPADGRLNTPDFMAKLTSVAWPATNDGREPTPGRRFVSFTLEVSALAQSSSPTAPAPTLGAALHWDGTSHPLSLASILGEIQSGAGSSNTASGSASYMADVPNDTHDVDLVLTEGTLSQSFDLWALRRVPPSPTVLYRDPAQTTVAGSAAAPATLSLSDPADGFTNSATLTLQSATLGFSAPTGTTMSPSADQAVLSVVLDAEFPNDPNDPTGSGHYLGSSAPLPASLLSFTPSGAGAMPATISDTGDTNGKGNSDDGLFDATYSFLVPATLTSGTLQVASGPFSGEEFTLFTAESGTTTLDVAAPATLTLSFPAPVAAAARRTPPWVGQPDPPTAAASGPPATQSSSPAGGFPIWLAVVILALLALGAVLFERRRRSRRLATATASPSPAPPVRLASAAPLAVVPESDEPREPEPDVVSESDDTDGPALNVIGPHEILGLRKSLEPRVSEVYRYLAFHKHRHLRAGQILIGMAPSGSRRADLTEKTVRNYVGQLRAALGVEHLPEANPKEGYILLDVVTDWDRFEALAREADVVGGEAADRLRQRALRLVRGVPFCDLVDDWIGVEGMATHMSEVIAGVARRLAEDRCLVGDFAGAQDAARRGLDGAPDDYALWEAGAVAIAARDDTTTLGRWMADASHHLTAADLARVEATLQAGHDGSPQS
jgi:multidrug efflux pump subunit AcrA (membrane-fusion protein)